MLQSLELSVAREALQARLLVELMGNAMHKELVLKGGMAMRVVHGSVRYTKDIDLDADLKHSKERVQGIVKRSIERSIAAGLISNARVSEPKQTETTLRWKIVGTQPGSDAPMNLTIEVSRRASFANGHIVQVPLPPAYGGMGSSATLQVLDSQAIAVTKILALTDPHRMAPRDLYDLHILIRAEVQPPASLLASLPNAAERLPLAMAELWPKIEAMTYGQFKTDVIPFLPTAVGAQIDEAAFDDMRIEVGENAERWLKAASEIRTMPPCLGGSAIIASQVIACVPPAVPVHPPSPNKPSASFRP
ncbi:putative nucleotidyltransferase component of viral defense system [Roseateles asaccharophilus]|uniref:nucleotidyl transferase AbiEii/AbiGii toxin family protein n=1 Tax=Roseateles asaccharophilus TaxID=582607 RepID=UPI003833D639